MIYQTVGRGNFIQNIFLLKQKSRIERRRMLVGSKWKSMRLEFVEESLRKLYLVRKKNYKDKVALWEERVRLVKEGKVKDGKTHLEIVEGVFGSSWLK